MSDNFTINETLHQYFDGELPAAASARFERELEQSPQLQEELQNLGLARYGLRQWALRNQIAAIHRDIMPQLELQPQEPAVSKTAKISKWWLTAVAVAAATVVMLFMGVFTQKSGGAASAGELFAANYKSYETAAVRGGTAELAKAYSQRQYSRVITLFETAANPALEDQFFAACAYLETGAAQKAAALYQAVRDANKSGLATGYADDAAYYQAMAYLKLNNVAAAKPLFDEIYNNPKHLYNDRLTDTFMANLRKLPLR